MSEARPSSRPSLTSRLEPVRTATLATFGVVFALGFLPLFGAPGYEHALVSGFVAPAASAVAVALAASKRSLAPPEQLLFGLRVGGLVALAAYASSIVHGVRLGFCAFLGPSVHFALTAGAGALLGGVWGAFVGEGARHARRRRLHAVLFAVAGPLVSIGIGLYRFVSSPMIFGFDPFVGYFAGTLYDTVVDAGTPLLTYRGGTLATVVGALAFARLLGRDAEGRLGRAPVARSAARRYLAVGVLAWLVSGAVTLHGPALSHWQTSTSIQAALAGRVAGPRCDVVFPDETAPALRDLMLRDCEEQLRGVERALGARGPDRVTAFFFRDKHEKKRLMGAADTYIAKPWRREVYLQVAPYPHPVLAHELAHVVAGAFAEGPFKVAGRFYGLVPDPGLIEGVAVAAAPEHDVLSDRDWCRAMLELGLLPPLDRVFSLGFLGESSAKSYTVAGAAVRFIAATEGLDKVHALYRGAPPERALGRSWRAIDDAFRAHLRQSPVDPAVLAYAKARFDRPAVFARVCPHEIDALVAEGASCRDSGRFDKAITSYDAALARNEREMPALLGRAMVYVKAGRGEEARAALTALLSDAKAPRTTRDKAEELLADVDFLAGRYEDAAARYAAIGARVLDEDAGRTVEVKAAMTREPAARGTLEALLVGTPGRGTDTTVGLVRAAEWRAASGAPLADYLLGRNLVAKAPTEALAALERATASRLPAARVVREALRQRVFAACIVRDVARLRAASDAVGELVRAGGVPSGWSEEVTRQLEVCGGS